MDKRKRSKNTVQKKVNMRTYCNQAHDIYLSMQMVLDSIFHFCNFTHPCCLWTTMQMSYKYRALYFHFAPGPIIYVAFPGLIYHATASPSYSWPWQNPLLNYLLTKRGKWPLYVKNLQSVRFCAKHLEKKSNFWFTTTLSCNFSY